MPFFFLALQPARMKNPPNMSGTKSPNRKLITFPPPSLWREGQSPMFSHPYWGKVNGGGEGICPHILRRRR